MKRRDFISGVLGFLTAFFSVFVWKSLDTKADEIILREFEDKPPYGFYPPHLPCISPSGQTKETKG